MEQQKTLFLGEFKKLLHYETPERCRVILQKKKDYSFPHMWEEYDRRNRCVFFISDSQFKKKAATLYNKANQRRRLVGLVKLSIGDYITYAYYDKKKKTIFTIVYKIEELTQVSIKNSKTDTVEEHFAAKCSLCAKNEGEIINYDFPVIKRAIYLLSALPFQTIPYSIPWKNYRGLITKYGAINPQIKIIKTVSTVDELYSGLREYSSIERQLVVVTTYIPETVPLLYLQPLRTTVQQFQIYEKSLKEALKETQKEEVDKVIDQILLELEANIEYENITFKLLLNQSNMEDDWFLSFKRQKPSDLNKLLKEQIRKGDGEQNYPVLRLFKW